MTVPASRRLTAIDRTYFDGQGHIEPVDIADRGVQQHPVDRP